MERRPLRQACLILLVVAAFVHDAQILIALAGRHQDSSLRLRLHHDSLRHVHLKNGRAGAQMHVLRIVLVWY